MRVRRLLPILGKRPALMFGGVTFLVAALLATVNLTSRYALKLYVEDQLHRIRWDVAVYQKGPVGGTIDRVPAALRQVPGVAKVESLAFLRAGFPPDGEVTARVDGNRITTPWVSLLAASDPSILPPQLGYALQGGTSNIKGAVLALVGPEREIGKTFLDLQGGRQFTVDVKIGASDRRLFDVDVKQSIRLDRDELNRWIMDQTGSVTFVPHIGLIVLMPFRTDALERFDAVAAGLVPTEVLGPNDSNYGHVHEAEYEPEIAYLGRFDRDALISGWDISESLVRITAANERVYDAARDAVRIDVDTPPTTTPGEGGDEPEAPPAAHEHSAWRGTDRDVVVPAILTPGLDRDRILLAHGPEDAEERRSFAAKFVVDSTTMVLLERMENLARLVGLVSVLVALPLLWVAWLLAANLAGLLMLNERRTLGLMRLRGIAGKDIGRALIVSIVSGGVVGGLLGVVAGSIGPLAIYEHGRLPLEVITAPQQLAMAGVMLAVSVVLSYVVSRRLVKFAMTISPLEASRRVSESEPGRTGMGFGILELVSLVLGAVVLGSWVWGIDVRERLGIHDAPMAVRLMDFAGLPLFVYGVAALLASRRRWLEPILTPITRLAGGVLGHTAHRHIAVKPHRTLAFLLIVALMASVSLYPTITSRSFEDKAVRGARVQLGSDWQFLFNAPDLVDVSDLEGGLQRQLGALQPAVEKIVSRVAAVPGVTSVTYLIEAVLPNFYLPDYGMRGVPAYLIPDLAAYRRTVYAEPEVGIERPFDELLARLQAGETVTSPSVTLFKKLKPGKNVRLGVTTARKGVVSPMAGTVAFLPGLPPRTVSDRQGYVQARIDYLNYLFSNNAYVVAAANNPKLADLRALIPRIIVLASGDGAVAPELLQPTIVAALPMPPLEVHNVSEEISKVSSDMYISLALANMRIYLVGGILLALIAIVSVAAANYIEDRRTLALMRIRGASPAHLRRFILALLLSPAVVGLVVGAGVALVAGFGLANHVWEMREIKTVVQLLPTRLILSPLWGSVVVLLLVLLIAVASAFSAYVYRRTARHSLQGA